MPAPPPQSEPASVGANACGVIVEHEEKLEVVDPSATIQRHACEDSGTHVYGRIETEGNPCYGLDFVHTGLSDQYRWSFSEFAALVSSIIKPGTPPNQMPAICARLKELGPPSYARSRRR